MKGIIFEEYIYKVIPFDCCTSCHLDEEEGYSMCSIEINWGEGEVCCSAANAWNEMTSEEKDKVREMMEEAQEE